MSKKLNSFSWAVWAILLVAWANSPGKLHAQGVPQTPDCQISFNLTAAGSTVAFDNRFNGCVTWLVQYQNTGFSGLTLTFQSATGAVTAGAFGTYGGTTVTGANPASNTTGETSTFANGIVSIPWVRMNLSGLTGSGNVSGVLYGFRTGSSGSSGGGSTGCPNPCPVIGVTASGSPPANPPVLSAGQDGTNTRTIKTDTAGDQEVVGSAAIGSPAGNPLVTGYQDDSSNVLAAFAFPDQGSFSVTTGTDVVVVAGTGGKLTYVAHLSFTADSAQVVTIKQGTGVTCGSNTATLFGPYPNAAAFALDFSAAGGLHTTITGRDLCIHFGGSVTSGGGVVYGSH